MPSGVLPFLGSFAGSAPKSYPVYARVLNPVVTPDGRRLRWSDVAGAALAVDGETQWSDIVSTVNPDPDRYYEPETGTIDSVVAGRLSGVLAKHTESEEFTYLVWDGYGSLRDEVLRSPTVTVGQQRVMHARRGGLETALEPVDFPPSRLAITWLPDDGAWVVGNDIYARSVFVGAPVAAVGAVLKEPGLEAYLVRAGYVVVPED